MSNKQFASLIKQVTSIPEDIVDRLVDTANIRGESLADVLQNSGLLTEDELAALQSYNTPQEPIMAMPLLPPTGAPSPRVICHLGDEYTDDGAEIHPYPVTLIELLRTAKEMRGTDLHLSPGIAPIIRLNNKLTPLSQEVLRPNHMRELLQPLITAEYYERFRRDKELDFSFGLDGIGRFRGNLFMQRGTICAIFRVLHWEVPSLSELGMPEVIRDLCATQRGLILITGPTCSGKSTTLASMIREMNETRQAHIVTLEDPIEYFFHHGQCEIHQRQIGTDSHTYASALKHVLRQDPDVILLSEMRDLETIATAMTAAETGHLVLATMHTGSAMQSISRIIDVFPPSQQAQVRNQLANVLEASIAQTLIPRLSGYGLVCAQEILIVNNAARTLIRDCKEHQLPMIIESNARMGMKLMDKDLLEKVRTKIISHEEALRRCFDHERFSSALKNLQKYGSTR